MNSLARFNDQDPSDANLEEDSIFDSDWEGSDVDWSTKSYLPRAAPRGNPTKIKQYWAAGKAALEALPGTWRACHQCKWARKIPNEKQGKQQHCTFPARGAWRCNKQLTHNGWLRCPQIAESDVELANGTITRAFESIKEDLNPPVDSRGRSQFFAALREKAASMGREEAVDVDS